MLFSYHWGTVISTSSIHVVTQTIEVFRNNLWQLCLLYLISQFAKIHHFVAPLVLFCFGLQLTLLTGFKARMAAPSPVLFSSVHRLIILWSILVVRLGLDPATSDMLSESATTAPCQPVMYHTLCCYKPLMMLSLVLLIVDRWRPSGRYWWLLRTIHRQAYLFYFTQQTSILHKYIHQLYTAC